MRPAEVEDALDGARIVGAGRRGKHLWLELDRRPWPLLHLGMTGALRAPDAEPLRLASDRTPAGRSWPPPHAKLQLVLDDGGKLAFCNRRRLGKLRLRDDPSGEPPVSDLGFDPLLDEPAPGTFEAAVRGRRANVKALLLDQQLVAGLGNWLVDEVLHRAAIDPRRRSDDLSRSEARALLRAILDIVRTAVEADADSSRFPPGWLFHRRWSHSEDREPKAPEALRRERVAGRTTLWSPHRQK